MFTRIDEKLKGVAKGFFWTEALISAIVGVVLAMTVSPAYLLVALAGVAVAWLSSIILYGFGEMITELKLNRTPRRKRRTLPGWSCRTGRSGNAAAAWDSTPRKLRHAASAARKKHKNRDAHM